MRIARPAAIAEIFSDTQRMREHATLHMGVNFCAHYERGAVPACPVDGLRFCKTVRRNENAGKQTATINASQ